MRKRTKKTSRWVKSIRDVLRIMMVKFKRGLFYQVNAPLDELVQCLTLQHAVLQ